MKKLLSVLILFAIIITLVSCSSSSTTNPIDYGKKYLLSESQYYVFEKDQTGYYEVCNNVDIGSPEYNYTLSGRVEFVWREASDGAVYLFKTKVSYNDDHTEGKEIYVISQPIYFSEDFFAYSNSNQYGTNTVRYIKEGSELEKSIQK